MVSFQYFHHLSIIAAIGLGLVSALPASAQTAPDSIQQAENFATQQAAPQQDDQERSLKALALILGRAQTVRILAAQHLAYLSSKRATPEVHQMEDAAQVMAYSLICADPEMDTKTLNDIANQSTLKIALLLDQSPAGQKIKADSAGRPEAERLALISDVASTTLMFKIGRRRGLFDSLKTDFGTKRFCAGLGGDMRKRYESLAADLGKHFH
ncbi:hypothetical protein [Kordiimonas marina]|uniref:hypothetical protein n=1 Tax=Kordiimonas marina TaxID=2872312 RepID=UPI001FF1B3B9|nr:hypothetical protein [Kordiimonas marina]MCJ9429501.1 hypothetical protein [Kordiimonas marina]